MITSSFELECVKKYMTIEGITIVEFSNLSETKCALWILRKSWLISCRLTVAKSQTPATCFYDELIEGNRKSFNFIRSHISDSFTTGLIEYTREGISHAWYVKK